MLDNKLQYLYRKSSNTFLVHLQLQNLLCSVNRRPPCTNSVCVLRDAAAHQARQIRRRKLHSSARHALRTAWHAGMSEELPTREHIAHQARQLGGREAHKLCQERVTHCVASWHIQGFQCQEQTLAQRAVRWPGVCVWQLSWREVKYSADHCLGSKACYLVASGSIGARHSQAAQRPVFEQVSPDLVYGVTGSRGARHSKALHTCSHLGSWSGSATSGPLLAALPSFLPAAFFLGGILLFRVSKERCSRYGQALLVPGEFSKPGSRNACIRLSWLVDTPPKAAP